MLRAVQRVKQQLVVPVVQRPELQRDLGWLLELLVDQRRPLAEREHQRRCLLFEENQMCLLLSFQRDLALVCRFRTRP